MAPLLSLALFSFFSLIGFAVLQLIGSPRNLLRNALLAPSVGAASLVLPLFTFFRLNLPIRRVALPLTILLAVGVAVILWRRRPALPLRQLMPFCIVLVAAFLLTGYPLFLYGFNWVSYVNDDMITYVQSAHYFADHGLYDLPDERALLESRNNAANYWFFYATTGARPGSDLLLAWLISVTRLTGYQIYMPLMIALHLGVISAVGALTARNRGLRVAAVTCCGWLAVSPLNTLGTVYQLMPQVCGLMLLITAGAILLVPLNLSTVREAVRWGVLAGVLVTALTIVYFEILPFLVVPFVGYQVLAWLRKRETPTAATIAGLATAVTVAAISLRTWGLTAVLFMRYQTSRSLSGQELEISLFPFYLVPSGLANLWGLLPIGDSNSKLALNLSIALGLILFLGAILASVWQAWRTEPAAVFSATMLAVAATLFAGKGGYGLFKLAMYIQPFLISSMVLAWFHVSPRLVQTERSRRIIRFLPAVFIAALSLGAQNFYVRRSGGSGGNGLAEVPHASESRLLEELGRLRAKAHRPVLISDSHNAEVSKVESLYFNPSSIQFPAGDFFEHVASVDTRSSLFRMTEKFLPKMAAEAAILSSRRGRAFDSARVFDMKTDGRDPRENYFYHREKGVLPFGQEYDLVESGPRLSPLNHRHFQGGISDVRFEPSNSVSNYLILVTSRLGGSHYITVVFPHEKHLISLAPAEPDYFYRDETMASVGRYLLFLVLRPTPKFRVVVDYTASLNADGKNRIPPVAAIGTERSPLLARGRGSGRFFSAPLQPQMIDGEPYLMLDMGTEPIQFRDEKSGLMTLYGRAIRADSRFLTGFVRDISIISDNEYSGIAGPPALRRFPDDLENRNLEYSGIYEDGWGSEDSLAVLQAPAGGSQLRLKGSVPKLDQREHMLLTLLVDGVEVANRSLSAGEFTIQCTPAVQAGKHRIEILSSSVRSLSAPDNRPVAFQLHYLGFDQLQPAETAEIAEAGAIRIGEGWYPFEKFAGDTFRWVANNAAFSIRSPGASAADLTLEVESGPGLNMSGFNLSLNGPNGQVLQRHVSPGRQTVRYAVRLAEGDNSFQLRVDGGGLPAKNDPRTLNFRVFNLRYTIGAR